MMNCIVCENFLLITCLRDFEYSQRVHIIKEIKLCFGKNYFIFL